MEFTLSKHAAGTLREREIRLEWVTDALNSPASTEPDVDDRDLTHALRIIPEFGYRVLRVIFNHTRQPATGACRYGLLRSNHERQTMNIEYDPEVDALYVRLTERKIIESEQVQPGIILDFDEAGKVVGVEVLNASKRESPPAPLKAAA